MHLVEYLTSQLNRPLASAELEMLRNISPQGVAKINAELCKGGDLEHTLRDLLLVFQCLHKRRTQLVNGLNYIQQMILSRMNRPPTLDELLLVISTAPRVLIRRLNEGLPGGSPLEDLLEELAMEFCLTHLTLDAKRLAMDHHKSISVIRLSPTTLPQSVVSVSSILRCDSDRIFVGFSPIVSWFETSLHQSPDRETNMYSIHLAEPVSRPLLSIDDFALQPCASAPASLGVQGPESQDVGVECAATRSNSASDTAFSLEFCSSVPGLTPVPKRQTRNGASRRVSFWLGTEQPCCCKPIKKKNSSSVSEGDQPTTRHRSRLLSALVSARAALLCTQNEK